MPKSDYEEIAILREPGSDVVAVITRRQKPSGMVAFSFSISKEFQRREGGPVDRTAYLNSRHIGAARRLLDMVEERLEEECERLARERRQRSANP